MGWCRGRHRHGSAFRKGLWVGLGLWPEVGQFVPGTGVVEHPVASGMNRRLPSRPARRRQGHGPDRARRACRRCAPRRFRWRSIRSRPGPSASPERRANPPWRGDVGEVSLAALVVDGEAECAPASRSSGLGGLGVASVTRRRRRRRTAISWSPRRGRRDPRLAGYQQPAGENRRG